MYNEFREGCYLVTSYKPQVTRYKLQPATCTLLHVTCNLSLATAIYFI